MAVALTLDRIFDLTPEIDERALLVQQTPNDIWSDHLRPDNRMWAPKTKGTTTFETSIHPSRCRQSEITPQYTMMGTETMFQMVCFRWRCLESFIKKCC